MAGPFDIPPLENFRSKSPSQTKSGFASLSLYHKIIISTAI
jgi:hypothetical protein